MTTAGLRALGKRRAVSMNGAADYWFCSKWLSPPMVPCNESNAPTQEEVQLGFETSEVINVVSSHSAPVCLLVERSRAGYLPICVVAHCGTLLAAIDNDA